MFLDYENKNTDKSVGSIDKLTVDDEQFTAEVNAIIDFLYGEEIKYEQETVSDIV